MNALSLEGVHAHIGAYHILHGVHPVVPKGKVTMLLGRNGAGKTTTLRTIMGDYGAPRAATSDLMEKRLGRCRRRRSPQWESLTCPNIWASSPI
ncbi:High-affinity branched-chain amino acid transport ATP-binding protein LivF [Bradyrhizobium ivorense]|uniref:High-affinity branched-chain amino acid transport ATP-binding protein LivF n=1 Tax=Bradyrhizobium ivorense TaxID=2511166 RepID=A0A508TDF3_9BRAD|nr:High-affinity branched-chain amino acid transport ATP-binding protein LivF [Bradyrhizobium ivorense]